ncbi:MAG: ComF family protein [Caldimonas sp.]
MRTTRWLDLLACSSALELPGLCAVCHGWGRKRVCANCVGHHAPVSARCRRCALEVAAGVAVCGACITEPPPYRSTLAAVNYDYPWDRLIAAFKFHSALDLAPAFTDLLVRAHRRSISSSSSSSSSLPSLSLPSSSTLPALMLPVPLSAARLRERGYNQAWELARRTARALHCAADPALLLRVRDTPHQLAFPPDRRAANVRGAFAVEPRRSNELRGRDVTVVDDVMTTGATGAEIARVLLDAGAANVDLWVVARTPRPAAQESANRSPPSRNADGA